MLRDIALVRADVGRLPFATGSIDAVHAGAALHCWTSPAAGVRTNSQTSFPLLMRIISNVRISRMPILVFPKLQSFQRELLSCLFQLTSNEALVYRSQRLAAF
jgi:hypothetical protein